VDTSKQISLPEWFCKVANYFGAQPLGTNLIVRISGDHNGRNGCTRDNQLPMQLGSGHSGHIDVSDQTGRALGIVGCEEVFCQGEDLRGKPKRPHESLERHTNGCVVIDDRN
jgi:hypothetical protein